MDHFGMKGKDRSMINEQTFQGNWDEVKGKLRGRWASLTDDDLFSGNVDQLVGAIQRKTGETREVVEQFFEQLSAEGAATFKRAAETARAGAQHAAASVQKASQKAVAAVREGYADVEELVRERPAESLAVVFGAGIITGVVVSLLLRWR
jgi:uncharacterized protein YjbJ (UPF0337 family)